jgi:segregation and condensation protein B
MDLSKESLDEIDAGFEEESRKKVEAALFISGRFLSVQELVSLTDVNPILLKKILEDLADKYKDSGVEVTKKDNLWKMDVVSEYTWMVNRMATGSSEFSKAEQETLAIIAYKQPMKQSVLVKIRGNKSYDHIRKFVEMGLIFKKKTGHTYELSLTDDFHDYFHSNADSVLKEDKGKDNGNV